MFNIGDKVKCIDVTSLELTKGKVYTVREVYKRTTRYSIYVKEIDSIFPFLERSFEKC